MGEVALTDDQRRMLSDGYEVFLRAFPAETTEPDRFAYKHFGNPYLLPVPATFSYTGGEVVAMQWYQGVPVTCDGRTVVAAMTADTAATEKGRGFPFLRCFLEGNRKMREIGVPFRIGNPDAESFPVVTKLGDEVVESFDQVFVTQEELRATPRATGLRGRLGLKGKCPLQKAATLAKRAEGFAISESTTCPFTEEDYDLINRSGALFALKRDDDYYRWRIDGQPGKTFRYLVAREGGRLRGFFVVWPREDGWTELMDWGLYAGAVLDDALFAALFLRGVEQGRTFFASFLSRSRNELRYFENIGLAGYAPAGEPVIDYITVSLIDEGFDERVLDGANWRVRKSDLDFSLNRL